MLYSGTTVESDCSIGGRGPCKHSSASRILRVLESQPQSMRAVRCFSTLRVAACRLSAAEDRVRRAASGHITSTHNPFQLRAACTFDHPVLRSYEFVLFIESDTLAVRPGWLALVSDEMRQAALDGKWMVFNAWTHWPLKDVRRTDDQHTNGSPSILKVGDPRLTRYARACFVSSGCGELPEAGDSVWAPPSRARAHPAPSRPREACRYDWDAILNSCRKRPELAGASSRFGTTGLFAHAWSTWQVGQAPFTLRLPRLPRELALLHSGWIFREDARYIVNASRRYGLAPLNAAHELNGPGEARGEARALSRSQHGNA